MTPFDVSFKVNDFYDLEAIHPADQPAVGEKAIALSRLYQQGYPVPPAVVVGRHVLASLFPDTSQFNKISTIMKPCSKQRNNSQNKFRMPI